ncbi:hypothetical protein FJT64_012515 [Amphibalanus amphitrite]|uniref:Uncharacterized protein n=1 Tax=Amphibalanus amphitrite TaxID=1232801 RepID=A0A6A4V3D9_AMPAM|nr:hypothetical protein FJT64_012515 [Amphibalanus amphitrite]
MKTHHLIRKMSGLAAQKGQGVKAASFGSHHWWRSVGFTCRSTSDSPTEKRRSRWGQTPQDVAKLETGAAVPVSTSPLWADQHESESPIPTERKEVRLTPNYQSASIVAESVSVSWQPAGEVRPVRRVVPALAVRRVGQDWSRLPSCYPERPPPPPQQRQQQQQLAPALQHIPLPSSNLRQVPIVDGPPPPPSKDFSLQRSLADSTISDSELTDDRLNDDLWNVAINSRTQPPPPPPPAPPKRLSLDERLAMEHGVPPPAPPQPDFLAAAAAGRQAALRPAPPPPPPPPPAPVAPAVPMSAPPPPLPQPVTPVAATAAVAAPSATVQHITETLARLTQQAAAAAAAPAPQANWYFPMYQPAGKRKKKEKRKKRKREKGDPEEESIAKRARKLSKRQKKLKEGVDAIIAGGDPSLPGADDEDRELLKEAMSEVPDMETAEYVASDAEGEEEEEEEQQEEPSRPRPPVPLPPADSVSSILVIDGFSKNRLEKRVGFADGYRPGEGSPSEGEPTPPPSPTSSPPPLRICRNGWPNIKLRVIRQILDADDEAVDPAPPPPPAESPPAQPYYYLGPAGALLLYMQPIDAEGPLAAGAAPAPCAEPLLAPQPPAMVSVG